MQRYQLPLRMNPLLRVSRDISETTIDPHDVSFSGRLTCPVTSDNYKDW